MSLFSLLPSSLATIAKVAAQEARKIAPPAPRPSEHHAEMNGYLIREDVRPAPLAVVIKWGGPDEPAIMAISYHPKDNASNPEAENARGEALALHIASPDRKAMLRKMGCRDGSTIHPSFFAPRGMITGSPTSGMPLGLWDAAEDANGNRMPFRGIVRPWYAIESKPTSSSVWTVEGWH